MKLDVTETTMHAKDLWLVETIDVEMETLEVQLLQDRALLPLLQLDQALLVPRQLTQIVKTVQEIGTTLVSVSNVIIFLPFTKA